MSAFKGIGLSLVLLAGLTSVPAQAGPEEATKQARQLILWFGQKYKIRWYDYELRARVAAFEVDPDRRAAFLNELKHIKANDAYSRSAAFLSGHFYDPEVTVVLEDKLEIADQKLRYAILQALLNHRRKPRLPKRLLLKLLATGDEKVKTLTLLLTCNTWEAGA